MSARMACLPVVLALLGSACHEPLPGPPSGPGGPAGEIAVATPSSAARPLLASDAQDVDLPVMSPAPGDQASQDVLFNGTNYFVVWTSSSGSSSSSCRIMGVHVTPAGEVLDDTLVVIGERCSYSIAIGFDGTSYLVVYHRWSGSTEDIYGVRVGTDGSLIEAEKRVASAGGRQFNVDIAWGQSSYLLVWEHISGSRRPGALRATRVSADGTELDPDGIGIPHSGSTYEQHPQVASDGTNWLVAWAKGSSYRVLGVRIDPDGQILDGGDAIPLDGCTQPLDQNCLRRYQPSLSFGGQHYLVAWGQRSNPVEAILINPDGSLASAELEVSASGISGSNPRTAFDGTQFWVTWTADVDDVSQIHSARIGSDGSVLDAPDSSGNLTVSLASAADTRAALAASPGQAFVTWIDERGPLATDIYGARLDGEGLLQDGTPEQAGFAVARAVNTQQLPAVASDGDGYLIAWADARDAHSWQILAVHVDAAGNVLDSPALQLGTGIDGELGPAVAYNDESGQYLVLWQDLGTTGAMQVGVTGALFEASGASSTVPHMFGSTCSSLVVGPSEGGFRLRCGRGNSLQSYLIRHAEVYSNGSVQVGSTSIIDNAQLLSQGLAYQGTYHLATRFEMAGSTFMRPRTSANLVGPTGNNLWSGTLPSQGNGFANFAPPASARPDGFLMVSWASAGLYSAFVDLSGTVVHASAALRGFDPDLPQPRIRAPAMAFDGAGHLLAWGSGDIQAVRLSDDGQVSGAGADNGGTLLAAEPGSESALSMATGNNGQVLLAYQLASGTPSVDRVRFRLLNPAPVGTGCQVDLDCASSHCVDGFCCNTPCGGGASDDCQACSVATGALVDGTCAVIGSGQVCRAVAGGCDLEELCDGQAADCPVDSFAAASSTCSHGLGDCDTGGSCNGGDAICHSQGVQAAGVECRAAAGVCDVAEQCDGVNGGCPADSMVWVGTSCRDSAGGCDPIEYCDGVTPDCPAEVLFEAGQACRPAQGECDLAETCSGSAAECPSDLRADDGAACTDGLCQQGSCDRSPLFVSQPATSAVCGQPYAYSATGAPELSGQAPFSFVLEQGPEGMSADSASGALSWTPTSSQVGSHLVSLRASNGDGSALQSFEVEVSCDGSDGGPADSGSGDGSVSGGDGGHSGGGDDGTGGAAADGCGCQTRGQATPGALLLGALLWGVGRRRRPHRG